MVKVCAEKQGGFLIVVRDEKLKHKFGISSDFSSSDRVNEGKWAVLTNPDTPDQQSHAVAKNSVCCVRKSGNVVTLLTLTDKALVQGLIDMSMSHNKQEQELAERLFESIICYAYQKEFAPSENE